MPRAQLRPKLQILDNVRFDLDNLDQDVQFHVTVPSLIRLVLSHPFLQMEVSLVDRSKEDIFKFELLHATPPPSDEEVKTGPQ